MDSVSRRLRKDIINTVACSKRGHVPSAFSIVEILRVLYDDVLKYDPLRPLWPERDRFILSKGHGCLALYVILANKGFFPKNELEKFCSSAGRLGGHPEYGKVPGIEASTGALGHGLSIGVGMALNARYEKSDYRTIVLLGDGECNEGSVWEAAMSASKHRLNSLLAIVDYNKQQSYGSVSEVQELEPFADKWTSFGFDVKEVDGHDLTSLRAVLTKRPFHQEKPCVLICHTIKGKGISFLEKNLEWHHKSSITSDELAALYSEIGR
ncbi:MAG: transketolase [Proteobacteria bacterium]|nr:transketolase [Pseudomonadota bacterium]